MSGQIEESKEVLSRFLKSKKDGLKPGLDRPEIVAHATLSALSHHWPSKTSPEILELLAETCEIQKLEHTRWAIQRRIATAKIARSLDSDQ
ncbi:MAG: hypothetical protein ACXWP5_09780 [Bdellovibrionota bacterium]